MTDQERRESHHEWLKHRARKRKDLEMERRGVDFKLAHHLMTEDESDAMRQRRDYLDKQLGES